MKVKGIIFEDTVNYKKISMTIMMPKCDFKCDRECGSDVCQNSHLAMSKDIDIKDIENLIDKYLQDDITDALVFQGLEPFDSWDDLLEFITVFRKKCDDDIVIYTGYTEEEAKEWTESLRSYSNIIIKYGRYIPGQESHKDEVLGVMLASDNQYARRIS